MARALQAPVVGAGPTGPALPVVGDVGGPRASIEFARVAWCGPCMMDSRVARSTAIPKVGLLYGLPAIARGRDCQKSTRLPFHLTFSDVKKVFSDGIVEIVFSATEVSKFMRQRAQLAS
jgi:hypothetical protein